MTLGLIQNAGPLFKSDPLFIDALKQYLCVSLSKNGVSLVPMVFQLSLDIFLILLKDYRQHVKIQLEIFFKDILLSMIELTSRYIVQSSVSWFG